MACAVNIIMSMHALVKSIDTKKEEQTLSTIILYAVITIVPFDWVIMNHSNVIQRVILGLGCGRFGNGRQSKLYFASLI